MCLCSIKFEHTKVCSLIYGSSTASKLIGGSSYIAARILMYGLSFVWLYSSQLKAHSLCVISS